MNIFGEVIRSAESLLRLFIPNITESIDELDTKGYYRNSMGLVTLVITILLMLWGGREVITSIQDKLDEHQAEKLAGFQDKGLTLIKEEYTSLTGGTILYVKSENPIINPLVVETDTGVFDIYYNRTTYGIDKIVVGDVYNVGEGINK